MFRVVLSEMIRLCQLCDQLEQPAARYLKSNADSKRLQQIPGIGPILAFTVLAEAGDLRRGLPMAHLTDFMEFAPDVKG